TPSRTPGTCASARSADGRARSDERTHDPAVPGREPGLSPLPRRGVRGPDRGQREPRGRRGRGGRHPALPHGRAGRHDPNGTPRRRARRRHHVREHAVSTIPHEVQEAARKHGELQRQNQIDLDAIKGVDEDAPTRAAAALALRIDGAGWSDIARVLDYSSAQRARKAVERVLADEAASVEQIEHVRWLNARRLEKILNSLMKRATNPKDPDHLQYARMAVVVID